MVSQVLRPPGRVLPVDGSRPTWDALLERPALQALLLAAERDLEDPVPVTPASDYLRYFRDGDRLGYESLVTARHAALSHAAIAAAATGGADYLDRVVDLVWDFCEQSTWCWPAHEDAPTRGEQLPDVERPYLDLGAGEVAAQLAWVDHLVGPQLEQRAPGVRRRIRAEAGRRVFAPFLERDWPWLGLHGDVHNWLAWIAGNVATAALVLADGAHRDLLLERVIECLDRYVASLPEDGAIDEGHGYWWNGACRALEAFQLLEHATVGALAAWRDQPALRATVGFPAAMHLGGPWFVNVADASARGGTDFAWPALFSAAVAVGDERARALAVAHRGEGLATSPVSRLGRLVLELADERWWSAEAPGPAPSRESWFDSVQLLVARQQEGSNAGLTLAVKGGHNGENHNHNDVGSFMVALDGVPVVVDLGRPTYTAQTFSADRYSIWTMQSGWHNVPRIRGAEQLPGSEHRAAGVVVGLTDDSARLGLDLAGAYGRDDVVSWVREVELHRASGRVELVDAWELRGGGDRSTNTLVLAGEPRVVGPRELVVSPLSGERLLRVTTDTSFTVEPRPVGDPMLEQSWGRGVHRVDVDLGPENRGRARVRFEAVERA